MAAAYIKIRFGIAWWVRPALGALMLAARLPPKVSEPWLGPWIERRIEWVVDSGVRPIIYEFR